MIITTTNNITGKEIMKIHGVVMAGVDFDYYPDHYSEGLQKAHEKAQGLIAKQASELGGNAIVGIRIEHKVTSEKIILSVSGTAVSV